MARQGGDVADKLKRGVDVTNKAIMAKQDRWVANELCMTGCDR